MEFVAKIAPRASWWTPSFWVCSSLRDARSVRNLCAARSLGSCTSRFYHPSQQSTCRSSTAATGRVQVFFSIAALWCWNGATWTHRVRRARWPSTCPSVGSARWTLKTLSFLSPRWSTPPGSEIGHKESRWFVIRITHIARKVRLISDSCVSRRVTGRLRSRLQRTFFHPWSRRAYGRSSQCPWRQ